MRVHYVVSHGVVWCGGGYDFQYQISLYFACAIAIYTTESHNWKKMSYKHKWIHKECARNIAIDTLNV